MKAFQIVLLATIAIASNPVMGAEVDISPDGIVDEDVS